MVSDIRIAMLFLVGFSIAGSLFIFITDDARADLPEDGYTSVITDLDDDEISIYGGYYGHAPVIRQMNGTLWKFDMRVITYAVDHEFWAHYSTDKGDTWNSFLIMDNSDPEFAVGGYPRRMTDAVVLSNNSIVILVELYSYDTTNNIELHTLTHWNNTNLSQWEEMDVYSSETYDVDYNKPPAMVINDEDHVMISYERNGLHFDLYNMATRSTISTYTKYPTVGANYKCPYLMCNASGDFFVGFSTGANPDYLNVYTANSSWSLIWSQGTSSSYYFMDCAVTADDTFVAVASMSSGGYNKVYYYNATGTGSRTYADASHADGYSPQISLVAGLDAWVYVTQYHKTEDRFATYGQMYYRAASLWVSSFTVIWDETEDSTKTNPWQGMVDLHPRIWDASEGEWIYTQLPETGFITAFGDYDVGSDDLDHIVIHKNSTTWQGIPWYFGPAPNIVTSELDNSVYGTPYSFTLTGEDGETPYIWSILVGPAWLNIGSSNGTLWGDPSGAETWDVTIRLTETHDVPRTDDQEYSLNGGSGVSEGEFDPSVAWALWWGDPGCISAFMVISVIVLVAFIIIRSKM